MVTIRHVGVIDIGKTNVKVAVVDLEQRVEIGVLTRPNNVLPGPPYPHYDIDGHWHFICDALKELNLAHGIDALSVTAHGASAVLLDKEGRLASPVIDYEFTGPDDLETEYDEIRPAFSETGSPRLSMGLNVGAQIHWQLSNDPTLHDRIATVLTYPQYWTYRLTGKLANEVTSLGCHTDLWCPQQASYSSLIGKLDLGARMAPVKKAADLMGPLLPDVAQEIGIPADLKVTCGIHDSNASLYPYLQERRPPFSVVSTGTWVITLAIGGVDVTLDPSRDTLMNVNAHGDPVPSARFMGGREFDLVMSGREASCAARDVEHVLTEPILLFPAVDPRSGPFQGKTHSWNTDETNLSDGERYAAVSFYLALMTAECLKITGALGPSLVEGPFARNSLYLDMLAAATERSVETSSGSSTGTSTGAALLLDKKVTAQAFGSDFTDKAETFDGRLTGYASEWKSAVQSQLNRSIPQR
ncbi:FGGY-family carbohydrate kinase [Roseibium porphyridii]|uniref:FGGY-family carbohydrate kinase n=1 Tax=Roseibium porphyridii TaxID=2866279 RepID=A0ABY8F736_9HYPH|nr:FGGY-family carbohydrate kinase [Roseibium sp. KMA01]WFE90309.1 FGGY-family carbohydrate kinase [Roseibium sp. KMA01]